jgi:glycosyltransferase involved in cell wall biosynthesis
MKNTINCTQRNKERALASDPISVCFTIYKAYPIFNPEVKSPFGGGEVDLYLLATELAKDERFKVSFVVGDYGQPGTEVIEGVTLYKSLDVEKNLIPQGHKIWSALKKSDADIYMNEVCSLSTVLHALFCKLNKKIFVYRTAHTNETDGTYFKSHRLRGFLVKWAFGQAEQLITQNDQDVGDLQSTLGLSSVVIRNACKIPSDINTQKNTVLWVGRCQEFKRPDLFLELAKSCPDRKFVMICPKGSEENDYETFVAQAQSIENLEFIRHCPFHKVDEYFQQARVFVSTSDSEGFPNTFVQACKAATPIISLNVNPDSFLDNYECGICCGGDMEKMKEQLKVLMETQAGDEMGKNARKYAEQNHDLAKITERYKEIFFRLIKEKAGQ